MNENKRLIMFFGVVALVVVIILVISFWPKADKSFVCKIKADGNYEKLGKVNYKQYQCLAETEGKNALVVVDELSDKDKEALNKAAKQAKHVIYYLDTESIDSADLKAIKKDLSYGDNSFKKNVILAIEKGKVISSKEGITSDNEAIYNFLKESKIAKFAFDINGDDEYENLGVVNYEQYKKLYDSEDPFAIVLGQTTCSYCISYKPIINEYAGSNNIPVYIIEIDTLSEDERNSLLSSLSYFKDNESWGTPLTLGIKNKEVVANIGGMVDDENTINEFFEKLGLK